MSQRANATTPDPSGARRALDLTPVAIGLAADGYRVLPLRPGGKVPTLEDWPNQATSDIATVVSWWTSRPSSNVGIATGAGLLVIDVDVKGDVDGYATLAALEAELGELPDTRRIRTPSGGEHRCFRVPPDVRIGNVGILGSGIDVRGDGGQVVGPGSVVDGRTYTVIGHEVEANLPAAWLERLTQPANGTGTGADGERYSVPRRIPSGSIDVELTRVAGSLRAMGMSPAEIAPTLAIVNQERAEGSTHGPRDFERIADSIGRKPAGELPGLMLHGGRACPKCNGWDDTAECPRPVLSIVRPPGEDRSPEAMIRAALVTTDELAALPDMQPLADGWLDLETFASIFGASGSGKSMVAIDLAMSVGLGRPWCGVPVNAGSVLYIAAEGRGSLHDRVDTWLANHGLEDSPRRPDVQWLLMAVNLMTREWVDGLSAVLAEQPEKPSLIVFDTLARSMAGGDENIVKDMTVVIDAADRLRRETGACVLLVHHTGWNETRQRGSTALRGALDTEIEVKRDGERVIVKATKQKSREDGATLHLRLQGAGLVIDSHIRGGADEPLDPRSEEMLLILRTEGPLNYAAWRARTGWVELTFGRHLTTLRRRGLVENGIEGWRVVA